MPYSKWKKHRILSKDPILVSALPETKKYTTDTLWDLIEKHTSVILKPSGGKQGVGVIKVTSLEEKKYEIHYKKKISNLSNKEDVLSYINKIINRTYIVQQYIPLITIGNRPVDIRVMVQREGKKPWEITGKLAKIAGPGYIITNIHRSKGSVTTVEDVLKKNNLESMDKIIKQIEQLSLLASKVLQRDINSNLNIVGLDIGVDQQGKVWIIEANFSPQIGMFLKLKNKKIYRKIYRIKNQNKK